MIHIILSPEQRAAVQSLRRDPRLHPAERDRLEMLLLSEAGWAAPRIATHLGCCPATVRRFLHAFHARGLAAVRRQRPGPPPDSDRRRQVTEALSALLTQARTWTAQQLATVLQEQGIHLSARQLRRHLQMLRARWRRTARTQRHKRDPARVAVAQECLAARKQRAAAGELSLVYLDEVGFSPSQPMTYSWVLPGQRRWVPYENPQGRRLNVLAALVSAGPEPTLIWWALPRTLTSDDLLVFLREALPPGPRPRVVVLDNAPIHTSGAVQRAQPDLERAGIFLEYLPPYSSQLNRIEPLFGGIKHHDLPERSYPNLLALYQAVSAAFERAEERLLVRCEQQLRPAA